MLEVRIINFKRKTQNDPKLKELNLQFTVKIK